MKNILISIVIALTAVGCANLVVRPRCDSNQGPYYCTKTVNTLISRGFEGKPVEQMFLPVLIIDWPFDAVVDTLLWPWDKLRFSK